MQTATEQCPWCGSKITRAKFEEITARIRNEEQAKLTEQEKIIRQQYDAKYRVELEKERKKAVEQLEKDRKKELDGQRQVLQQNHQKALLKKDSDFNREREKLQKKVGELERRLQNKPANELGDGAEIDLVDVLKENFPDDRIKRVPKGEPGADVHQEVVYKGRLCGLIVLDSKNRQSWQRSFATKLHEDQLAANADHAVLSTTVFPSGKKELCIEEGVILVNPGRAAHIITILRNALIKMHVRGLSLQERQDKTDQLYRLITSDRYKQRFAEAGNLTKRILDLDVQEQEAHQNVWKKRGQLATRLQNVLGDIDADVSSIVEGPCDPAEEPDPAVVGQFGDCLSRARK